MLAVECAAAFLLVGMAEAQVTERVSLGPGYQSSPGDSDLPATGQFVSADGSYVVFAGGVALSGGSGTYWQALVRDRLTGATECASVDASGAPKGADSGGGLSISSDGHFVVFLSVAPDLVPGDTNGASDVFVRDLQAGTTERISVASSGLEANALSWGPGISADGRFVTFVSLASNLVAGDTNGTWDVFVRDRLLGTTERVSVSGTGVEGDGASGTATMSASGRFVAFTSEATTLVSGDTNGHTDVFIRDRQVGSTERVSVAPDGSQADGDSGGSYLGAAVLSSDGRFVAFASAATNLVLVDGNGRSDVFVRDLQLGTTALISVGPGGVQGNEDSNCPVISDDGGTVCFRSFATNLIVPPSPNPCEIYVSARVAGGSEIVSTTSAGTFANAYTNRATVSATGRFVVLRSAASNLVAGDTNGSTDVFLKDRFASGFTSLCDPGLNNVIACPCANPPVGPGRGCNNSSFTGGASLAASGFAYLAQDSLVFTTALEKPTATSILLQGTGSIASGVVFGQGVRCAGGQLKRMYVKIAVNGSITAPDSSTSDVPVSVRSAQFGIPIQPGQPYLYQVHYRDSTVQGGCPSLSTFNATQAGSVSWWP